MKHEFVSASQKSDPEAPTSLWHSLFSNQELAEITLYAVALALACIVIPLVREIFFAPKRRRRSPHRPKAKLLHFPTPGAPAPRGPKNDPHDQMEAVSRVRFRRRPLMNKTEYRVFKMLEQLLPDLPGRYRLMSQTSMGELLSTDETSASKDDCNAAFASINAKRLDFALVDARGLLCLAIEVQGSGHHLSRTAFMRDAVKREALRRADVPMLEVQPAWTLKELSQQLRTHLRVADAPPASASKPQRRAHP